MQIRAETVNSETALKANQSVGQNSSSNVLFNALQISMHRLMLGLYFPASINPMVCLATPIFSASCSCVKSHSTRAIFIRLFFIAVHTFQPLIRMLFGYSNKKIH